MDIGAWQATVHGVAMSQTRLKQLSMSLSCKTQVWQTRLEPHVFKQLAMIGKSARVRATVLAHTLCLTGTRETQLSYPMSPTPVFLPGESQGWGSLVAAIYGVAQSRTGLK